MAVFFKGICIYQCLLSKIHICPVNGFAADLRTHFQESSRVSRILGPSFNIDSDCQPRFKELNIPDFPGAWKINLFFSISLLELNISNVPWAGTFYDLLDKSSFLENDEN